MQHDSPLLGAVTRHARPVARALRPARTAWTILKEEGWESLVMSIGRRLGSLGERSLRDLLHRKRAREFRVAIGAFARPYKLHVGCGQIRFDGWVNIDAIRSGETTDIVWDVTQRLPLDEGTCWLIYSEHLVEHLPVEDAVEFLKECHRVLMPGGAVRIAMPSLETLVERYASPNWRDQDWLSWESHTHITTACEMLNVAFRSWGHQWLYDRQELHRRLHQAGFMRIIDAERGSSSLPDLQNRERRPDSLLICEAYR